jgi:hypothetical protein
VFLHILRLRTFAEAKAGIRLRGIWRTFRWGPASACFFLDALESKPAGIPVAGVGLFVSRWGGPWAGLVPCTSTVERLTASSFGKGMFAMWLLDYWSAIGWEDHCFIGYPDGSTGLGRGGRAALQYRFWCMRSGLLVEGGLGDFFAGVVSLAWTFFRCLFAFTDRHVGVSPCSARAPK